MDWQDLYVPTSLEQYDYAPMANLWTTTLHEADYCMIGLFQSGVFTYNPYDPLGPIRLPGFGFTYCLVSVSEFSGSHYCDRVSNVM